MPAPMTTSVWNRRDMARLLVGAAGRSGSSRKVTGPSHTADAVRARGVQANVAAGSAVGGVRSRVRATIALRFPRSVQAHFALVVVLAATTTAAAVLRLRHLE